VAVGALLVCVLGAPAGDGLLSLMPALLLACTLFARRFPGARLFTRLTTRRRDLRLRIARARRSPRVSAAYMPRGGLLMGFALAVRPPPARCAAS
jgi:hypothetical protein